MNKIKIMVVDDHPVVREGIKTMINSDPGLKVNGEASCGLEAIENYEKYNPDITLVDISMPDMDGIEVIKKIKEKFPKSKFIILTVFLNQEDVLRAYEAGVSAYLLKDSSKEEIALTIKEVFKGKTIIPNNLASLFEEKMKSSKLTEREFQVLHLIYEGKSDKEIAKKLNIEIRTAKAHVSNILKKLNAENRRQAVFIAIKKGIIK